MIVISIESVDPHEGTMIAKATFGDQTFRINMFIPTDPNGNFISDSDSFVEYMNVVFLPHAERHFYGDKFKNHIEMEAPDLCKRRWRTNVGLKIAIKSVDAHSGTMVVLATDDAVELKFTLPIPREPNGHVVRDELEFRRQTERTVVPEYLRIVKGDPRKREIEALSEEILQRKWSVDA